MTAIEASQYQQAPGDLSINSTDSHMMRMMIHAAAAPVPFSKSTMNPLLLTKIFKTFPSAS
jgi:hypothetical protein